MATTKDVITNFLHGDKKGVASRMYIEGDKLYNFDTVIAQRINGTIHLNVTKYSPTTSKHQNYMKREMPNANMCEGVPMGASDIAKYF